MLKILAYADDLLAPDLPTWLPRARSLIAKAEAILAQRAGSHGCSPMVPATGSGSRSTGEIRRKDASLPDHRVRSGANATGRRRHHQRNRCPCGLPAAVISDRPAGGTWPTSTRPRRCSQRSSMRRTLRKGCVRAAESRLLTPDEARPLRRASSFQEHRNGRRFHSFLIAASNSRGADNALRAKEIHNEHSLSRLARTSRRCCVPRPTAISHSWNRQGRRDWARLATEFICADFGDDWYVFRVRALRGHLDGATLGMTPEDPFCRSR